MNFGSYNPVDQLFGGGTTQRAGQAASNPFGGASMSTPFGGQNSAFGQMGQQWGQGPFGRLGMNDVSMQTPLGGNNSFGHDFAAYAPWLFPVFAAGNFGLGEQFPTSQHFMQQTGLGEGPMWGQQKKQAGQARSAADQQALATGNAARSMGYNQGLYGGAGAGMENQSVAQIYQQLAQIQ